jgi:DNA polymerase-4
MSHRKIIHIDLDAFFCAVEELRHPELRGKPFAVGGSAESRGVIASCSYAARAFGISSAMPTSLALRRCPQLILLHGDRSAYSAASRKVISILEQVTPHIEQISIDEAFLDVSDLPQSGLDIARNLQQAVHRETQLPCSLGVASNKLVAKIATNTAKASHRGNSPPNAILEVPAGQEAKFLSPLPVRALWGVGPKTAARLSELGIQTIGDLARMPEKNLIQLFGKYGHDVWKHANGQDESPVEPEHEIKSISSETTFERDISDPAIIRKTMRELTEQVGERLRKTGIAASVVRIKVRWPDFSSQTRQKSIQQATSEDSVIELAAWELLDRLWDKKRPIRLIGVGVSGFIQGARQLSLWETPSEKERKLLDAVDDLKNRFGKKVIQKGNTLKKKQKDN